MTTHSQIWVEIMEDQMNSEQNEVGYMKKISLSLVAATSEKNMDPAVKPFDFNFVYGVGAEGITLFEKALFGKRPGDEIAVEVSPHQVDETLGHLRQPIQNLLPGKPPYFLKVRVVSVDTPGQRELIRAIAAGAGSDGCGSDCGCGCGC
jgi:hypothetical protein